MIKRMDGPTFGIKDALTLFNFHHVSDMLLSIDKRKV